MEVEEMMKEILTLANSQFEDQYLFAGSRSQGRPFDTTFANVSDIGREVVANVENIWETIELSK